MKTLRVVVQESWDQLLCYSSFAAYGAAAIFNPPVSQGPVPDLLGFIFNAQLTVAGLLLLVSLFTGQLVLRRAGYISYMLGMFMVSVLILLASRSPVFILILGFGLQGLVSVRYVTRDKNLAEELGRVLKEHGDGGH